jgi:DNA-binding response OmpR family regulator
VARNGTEALQIVKTFTPDVVLLDIMMPDVNGYEICQYIKSQKKLQNTHVVFLSAKSSEADKEKGISLGASLYIAKPFSTRLIVSQIKSLLAT